MAYDEVILHLQRATFVYKVFQFLRKKQTEFKGATANATFLVILQHCTK